MVRTSVKPVQLATIEEAFAAHPLQAVRPGLNPRQRILPFLLPMWKSGQHCPLVCNDARHARMLSMCTGSDGALFCLQVVPSRQVRGSTAGTTKGRRKGVDSAQAGPADAASAAPVDPTDQLPRTDISAQITDDLLRRLASPNWKVSCSSRLSCAAQCCSYVASCLHSTTVPSNQ